MPRRAPYLLRWSSESETYEVSAGANPLPYEVVPDSPGWFAWLDENSSFAFYSRTGAYCTVRKESVQQSGAYWYAYRSLNQHTVKHYAGRTADLTLARLEEIAGRFTGKADLSGEAKGWIVAKPASEQYRSSDAFTDEHSPLLESKLQPPRAPQVLVERSQLFTRLDVWSAHKLTLLAAPAGFGKTTLVSHWLTERRLLSDVAWVSLDSSDNDPVRFWRYILTSCQVWNPSFDQHPLSLLHSSTQPSLQPLALEAVLTSFLNQVNRQSNHSLLILEDYHVISEPRIHETLAFFLTHLSEKLHVMLMTRHEPPLPLVRLRANGAINDILASELRFSREETVTFLGQTMEMPLSEDALEQLDTHLEGWAAGLRLLSLSLQGKRTESQIELALKNFRGGHRLIRDYFVTEVLHAQPGPLQDFLLRTSVLTRLNPSLCAAVTGRQDSAALLESIERANLFLEAFEGSGEWYRYHALFAEAMQHEAHLRLGEEELRALSYAASHWFEEHGLLSEAVEAALKTGDSARSAVLIERCIDSTRFRDVRENLTLRRWLEQLPEATIRQYARLCFSYAVVLIFSRRDPQPDEQQPDPLLSGRVEELLRIAEDRWRSDNDLVKLGTMLALRAFLAFQSGPREQAINWARQALEWLPETEFLWRGMSLSVLGINALQTSQLNEARQLFEKVQISWKIAGNHLAWDGITLLLGMIYLKQGLLRQANECFNRPIDAPKSEEHPVSAVARLSQAQVFYEWNDLETMKEHMQAALRLSELFTEFPQEVFQISVELAQACLLHAEGQTALAAQKLVTLLSNWRSYDNELLFYFYQEVQSWLVRFFLLLGDHAAAQRWLNDAMYRQEPEILTTPDRLLLSAPADEPVPMTDLREDPLPARRDARVFPAFVQQKALLRARLNLARGEAEAALEALKELLPEAQVAGHGHITLQIKLLMAQAYAARKQLPEARQVLLEGLKQGYAEDFRRTFLDEGENMVPLLRDLFPHLRAQALRSYVQLLLQAFAQARTSQSTIVTPVDTMLVEPLSTQEQRVLRLLASGRSNLEIARELVVSVNTVRSQVQSIYRKLQVHNRHAACEIARELHLL